MKAGYLLIIIICFVTVMKGQNEMFSDKLIKKEVIVNASAETVYKEFVTEEGVKNFFAPEAKVEYKIGGAYEMYFDPSQPYGTRGGEGLHILSYLPNEMLSFEWNAPPSFGELRGKKTWVVIKFTPIDSNQTKVELNHTGWRKEEGWDGVFNYFTKAWDVVLGRLKVRFNSGPIDWTNPWYPDKN